MQIGEMFPRLTSSINTLVSALVIAGWIAQIQILVQIRPVYAPMQVNTALAFLIAAGLLWTLGSKYVRTTKILLLLLPLLPCLTLIQNTFNVDLGIDQFFIRPFIVTETIHPGRMSSLTASAFLLLALCFYCLLRHPGKSVAQITALATSLTLLGISLIAVFGYIFDAKSAYDFGTYTPMALHTSLLFLLNSITLVPYSYSRITKSSVKKFLPMLTTLSLFLVTILAWQVAILSQKRQIKEKFLVQTQLYGSIVEQGLASFSLSLLRMVKRWEMQGGTSEHLWRADALWYVRTFKGITGLGYANSDSIIQWIEPQETNRPAVGFQLNSEITRKNALDLARQSDSVVSTKAITLKQGGRGFLFIAPISSVSGKGGYIYAAIRYEEFFKSYFDNKEYHISIYENADRIFTSQITDNVMSSFWQSKVKVAIPGTEWEIMTVPLPSTIEHMSNSVPSLILFAGTGISFLIGYLVHLQISSRYAQSRIAGFARWNQAIVTGSQLAIISTDEYGLVKSFNPAAEILLEYKASEVIDRETPALWHEPEQVLLRAGELSSELNQVVPPGFSVFTAKPDRGIVYQEQWNMITKTGKTKTVTLAVHALHDDASAINGYVGIIEDVTEKLAKDAQLKDAISKAHAASTAKSQFLANMSHEIRTPINGVLGMAGLMLDSELTSEQRNYAEAIETSAENLLVIINDILDLSKIEAGKLDLEILDFELEEVIRGVEQTLGFSAKSKGISFVRSQSTDIPQWISGDPTRLRQILLNLVSNAIKFTNQGRVTLTAILLKSEGDRASLRFEVSDTGIGIPKESISKLFKVFSQAESSTARRFGGSGLGLSICAFLVQLMKGTIGVESEFKKGSTFWFEIDVPIAAAKVKKTATVSAITKPFRILLAEDNAINQLITKKALQKYGHRIDVVSNGAEVINALQKMPYDLVLMDCHMPEIDGYEATRMIRASESFSFQNIPIVAMTANAMNQDRESCLEAGMTDYATKPIKAEDLEVLIQKIMLNSDKARPRSSA